MGLHTPRKGKALKGTVTTWQVLQMQILQETLTSDRKSMTGWIFTYNGVAISWVSKKQGLVTRSTMELELVAGSFTSAKGIWLIRLGKDFRQDFSPIPIFTDT